MWVSEIIIYRLFYTFFRLLLQNFLLQKKKDYNLVSEFIIYNLFYIIFQAAVIDVKTVGGEDAGLVDLFWPEEEEELEPPAKKVRRDTYKWQKKATPFRSKVLGVFPEQNYLNMRNLCPSKMFSLVFDDELFTVIAQKSNEYALKEYHLEPAITPNEIKIFFAILLLSGYNHVTDYLLYWSNSEDTANPMVKNAISRNRFKTVKRCFHLGEINAAPLNGKPDRY